QEVGDAGQRLVGLRVEHVQDSADQQRVAGLLPVIAALQGCRAACKKDPLLGVMGAEEGPLIPMV
ncbi:MAG: hypothetical protein B7Y78_04060, partial [Caulobacter sp. 35-67-4]